VKERICIITTAHPAFDARIFLRGARSLAEAGYNVHLVAQHDASETQEGVSVMALKKVRTRAARLAFVGWRAFFAALRKRADAYHFHDPEFLVFGLLLHWFRRKPVIYDVHEDLPAQIHSKEWIPQPLRRPAARLARAGLRFTLKRMSAVVAATQGVADSLALPTRPVIIRNFPVLDMIPERVERCGDGAVRAVYVGRVSEERGLGEMLEAMRILHDEPIELVLQGTATPSAKRLLQAASESDLVRYVPWAPPQGAYRTLASADIGLACLRPVSRFQSALPVKLFEYMACGIPVIASDFPLWREIVGGAECGLLVDPLDPCAIAGAIRYLLEHPEERAAMGRSGRASVETEYNWEAESAKLLDLYSRVLGDQ